MHNFSNSTTCRTSSTAARFMKGILIVLMLAGIGRVAAADYYKTAGNLAVYLGVLPAQMAQGHSPEHPEGWMHGGVPSSKRQHHVVIAVFNTKDGSRVVSAAVKARVTELGLGTVEKKLEPMIIEKTTSYGNYFSMGSPGPYRIEVEIVHAGSTTPVKVSFEYSHPRR